MARKSLWLRIWIDFVGEMQDLWYCIRRLLGMDHDDR